MHVPRSYFTLILYTVVFCQLFNKDVMDGITVRKLEGRVLAQLEENANENVTCIDF